MGEGTGSEAGHETGVWSRPIGNSVRLREYYTQHAPVRERAKGCERHRIGGRLLDRGNAPPGTSPAVHFASPDTRLIDVAMITAPSGNESHAWRSAARRISLDPMFVSETWNVMPIVNAR